MKQLVLFCLALMWSVSANAITYPNNMDPRLAKFDDTCGAYEIFHINGILTDQAGAAANLQTLMTRYGNSYKAHIIQWGLAYNKTVDWDNDLADSYRQVVLSFPGTTMEEYVRAVVLGMYPSQLLTSNIVGMLSGKWASLFHIDRPSPYQDEDLTNIYNAIYGAHRQNGRVMLIPHSQGTLYANLVYDRLLKPYAVPQMQIQAKALRIMAIASAVAGATGGTRGGGLHVTNTNDLVINAVRAFSSTTLAANTTVNINGLGHNLRDVYLNWPYAPHTTTNKILANMTVTLDSLKSTQLKYVGMWLRGQAEYVRCGPAAWPYGTGVEPKTEIQCPITRYTPVYPYSYLWMYSDQDYVKYTPLDTTPNKLVDYEYIIGGAPTQAFPLAKAYIEGCYKALLADRKAQILAGVPASPYYPSKSLGSCGNGFPANEPYGLSAAAWNLYSGDVAPNTFQANSLDVKSDMYYADMKPMCKY